MTRKCKACGIALTPEKIVPTSKVNAVAIWFYCIPCIGGKW